MEAALRLLVPRIVPDATFDIYPHQGIGDLFASLPGKLKGYQHWAPDHYRYAVVLDEDRVDCRARKQIVEDFFREAGIPTKSRPASDGSFRGVTRLAVEELEAWLLGDAEAVTTAFPRIPDNFASRARYRDPDGIAGGTWEALQHLLQSRGYHRGGLRKTEAAIDIARHMEPSRNRSRSFGCFCDGLRALR